MPASQDTVSAKAVKTPLSKDEIMRRLKSLPKEQLKEVIDNLRLLKEMK